MSLHITTVCNKGLQCLEGTRLQVGVANNTHRFDLTGLEPARRKAKWVICADIYRLAKTNNNSNGSTGQFLSVHVNVGTERRRPGFGAYARLILPMRTISFPEIVGDEKFL